VALWLGHSDIQTTERYLRVDPSEELDAPSSITPPSLRRGVLQGTRRPHSYVETLLIMRRRLGPTHRTYGQARPITLHIPELRIHHVVFIPKCRRKKLYLELRKHLGEVFRKLATQKESKIEEGHLLRDHVHMMIAIPPKYAVSQVIGYIKGKSAIHLARVYGEKKRNFVGQHFWARGYFVSTVGRDEEVIREYIRAQEKEDSRLEQMNLWR
jgi:putative transposase